MPAKLCTPISQASDQAGDHHDLGADADPLGAEAVDQHAERHPQQRAGQHRGRDHQALLGGIEVQVPGDGDAERTKQHPDHEAEVEIQERGEQRRHMAGLDEAF